jgi:hypothetical protein
MMSKRNPAIDRATRVVVAALLAFAASGCSRQASDAQSTAAPVAPPVAAQATLAPAAVATTGAQPDAVATLAAQPQAAATVAEAAPAAGIASSDGDKTGTRVVIDSLSRGSDTVTLKFTLINDSSASLGMFYELSGSGYSGGSTTAGVTLVDTVSKKKYFALADTDKTCICSRDIDNVAPNAQVALWVKFPAPPPSVTKITVDVPHFIPLDDVPISQ